MAGPFHEAASPRILKLGTPPPNPRDLSHSRQNDGARRQISRPPLIPAPESALGVASPRCPYSGSEGEMLREGFSTVVAARALWKSVSCLVLAAMSAQTRAGTPPLRIAEPDTRCPRIEFRAAGCTLSPKRILRCCLEGLRRLYYKAFAETRHAGPHLNSDKRIMEPEFAAFVAIDWADQKHAWTLELNLSSDRESGNIDHAPEAVDVWAAELTVRFPGRPIAVALEQSRGPLAFMLTKYEHLVIFPIHPSTLANYRKSFRPSGAKDDPMTPAFYWISWGATATSYGVLIQTRPKHGRCSSWWRSDANLFMKRRAIRIESRLI